MFTKGNRKRPRNYFVNIFSSNSDYTSKCLKRSCFQKCFYETNKKNNIVKYFVTDDVYRWETTVYLFLLHRNIVPLASIVNVQQICYQTSDTYTLYEYISRCENIHHLLNEAFSFVKSFSAFGFVHGNANVFNILVDKTSTLQDLRFLTIDFSNSYIVNEDADYPRSLDHESIRDSVVYWDLFCLYMSLKSLPTFQKSSKESMYLERLITNYVNSSVLTELMRHYTYLSNQTKRQLLNLDLDT